MMPPVSGNSALFLDIDGTLLDMARTPDAVVVPHDLQTGAGTAAGRIAGRAGLCQRPLAWRPSTSCSRRFRTAAIGCHGGEMRGADGKVARAGRAHARFGARAVSRPGRRAIPALLLEDKIYALALHYRLAPEARPVLNAAMEKHADLFAAEKVTSCKASR